MMLTTALLLLGMMTVNAAISTTKEPAPKSADSYESPTTGAGDMSTVGEASAREHETSPLNHGKTKKKARQQARSKMAGKHLKKHPPYDNCDTDSGKERCKNRSFE